MNARLPDEPAEEVLSVSPFQQRLPIDLNSVRLRRLALEVPTAADRYSLAAHHLDDANVRLNGRELALGASDTMPNRRAHTPPPDA